MPMEAEGTPLSARTFCARAETFAAVSGGRCWAWAVVVAARRVAARSRRMMGKDNIPAAATTSGSLLSQPFAEPPMSNRERYDERTINL